MSEDSPVLILLTNDDGIHSAGLRALEDEFQDVGRVVVVAPDRNRSAIAHALTLESPLRAEEIQTGRFAVDGTPTDCVNLAVHGLLQEKPSIVVSGINRGANLGDDITYSGTVCAAMEATLMGVPSFAISLDCEKFNSGDLKVAAQFARRLAMQVMDRGLPEDTFLNVNVPTGGPEGVRLTRQGRRRYGEGVVCKKDPRGRAYFWIGGGDLGFEDIPGSDCNALNESRISVTPLHINLTNDDSFESLRLWSLENNDGMDS